MPQRPYPDGIDPQAESSRGAKALAPRTPRTVPRGAPARAGRNACGFTLIEVMVVLGIVALLALLAAPSYQEKYMRDQIVEALPLANIAKAPIAAAWSATQSFPADNAAAGLPPAEKIVSNYVSATTIEDGAIHMTFGNRAHGGLRGRILSLRPAVVPDAPIVPIAWVCGYSVAPVNMTLHGMNRTDIPNSALPAICRAVPPG